MAGACNTGKPEKVATKGGSIGPREVIGADNCARPAEVAEAANGGLQDHSQSAV